MGRGGMVSYTDAINSVSIKPDTHTPVSNTHKCVRVHTHNDCQGRQPFGSDPRAGIAPQTASL